MLIDFMAILVTIFGVLMSIGHFPQAYKIYKNKDSKSVSIFTYSILVLGSIVWLTYGILLKDIPLISTFIVGIIGSTLVLTLIFKYR